MPGALVVPGNFLDVRPERLYYVRMANTETQVDLFGPLHALLDACREGTFYEDYDDSTTMLFAAQEAVLSIQSEMLHLTQALIDITDVDPFEAILDPTRPIRIAEEVLRGHDA